MSIREQFESILRYTSSARIIAVTKYVDSQKIIEAYEAGLRDFGENKAQDAETKRQQLPREVTENSVWHFIGHLQSNKVKKVAGKFDYIHSVDSFELAKEIAAYAQKNGFSQKILLQVNVSGEKSKFGFCPETVGECFPEINKLESLSIVGLMTMAPFMAQEDEIRKTFAGLRTLRDKIEKEHSTKLPELSMGMSNDYKLAVQEGSTMLRIGSELFKK